MRKGIINKILFVVLIFFTPFAFADTGEEDFGADNYQIEDEGRLLFKFRGFGTITNAKEKGFPTPTAANPKKPATLVKNGFGADTATVIFFGDRVATELSLGFGVLKTKGATIVDLAQNYGGTSAGKKKDIYMIPLAVTLQYHIAPFGGIDPYVGAGYHGSYLFTKSKQFKVKSAHGAVLQIGVDFVAKDDTVINVDFRQFMMKTKVSYKNVSPVGGVPVSSKLKINPFIISAGIGFKF